MKKDGDKIKQGVKLGGDAMPVESKIQGLFED